MPPSDQLVKPFRVVGDGARARHYDVFFSWYDEATLTSSRSRFDRSIPYFPLPRSCFHHDAWEVMLRGHPDVLATALLLDMFRHGANIACFDIDRTRGAIYSNHPLHDSVRSDWLLSSIAADVKAGHSSAPTPRAEPRFRNTRNAPLSVVPKTTDGKQTGWRRIYNASYPRDASVNDATRKIFTRCDRWDAFIAKLVAAGHKAWLFKEDVDNAFRNLSVRQQDQHLLGLLVNNTHIAYELRLPFGLRASPACWGRVAAALHWILEKHGALVVHYHVDDFIGIIRHGEDCAAAVARFRALCKKLGVPLSAKKAEGPSHELVVCGVLVNTVTMTLSITAARHAALLETLRSVTSPWAERITRKALARLVGRLAFVAKVFPAGRAFYANALAMLRITRQRRGGIAVSAELRQDCQFWIDFLPLPANGVSAIPMGPAEECIFTDACGTGYGVFNGITGEYILGQFSPAVLAIAQRSSALSMPMLELYALLVAASAFGHQWHGRRISFRTDCLPAMFAVSRGLSHDPHMQQLLRSLSVFAVTGGWEFRAWHIAGVDNRLSDLLSRGREQEFLAEAARVTRWATSSLSQVTCPPSVSPAWGLPF